MQLNELGQIANNQWHQIPAQFENIKLDQFVVMPNHVHGILFIVPPIPPVRAGFTPAPSAYGQPQTGQPQGLPLRDPNVTGQPPTAPVRAGFTPALSAYGQPPIGQPQGLPLRDPNVTAQSDGLPRRNTIGNIVGAYKSLVANECLKIFKTKNEFMGKLWQRNYYEHIIRDENSYSKIAEYIANNPARWQIDTLFMGEKHDHL